MEEVLNVLNKFIRAEHGNHVTLDGKWIDAGVDSFGSTMVFCDMDEKYGCFDKVWFTENTGKWEQLTVREIVERAINESTKL